METVKAQVIVCGGGTAGLPAALMAARCGLSVIIIEEDERIGGAVCDQYIQNYCGGPVQGVYKEIKDTMSVFAPPSINPNCFRHSSYILAWYVLFKDLDINIFTKQKIIRTVLDGKKIIAVETNEIRYEGDIFIDATGDGAVVINTPCQCRYGRESRSDYNERFAPEISDNKVQLCTLMFSVRKSSLNEDIKPANWAVLDSEEYLIWGPTVYCEDTTSVVELQKAQNKAMSMMPEQSNIWNEKGYYITSIAPKLGVRESRRIIGNYTLSYNDIMNKISHLDSVCVVTYGIDPWDPEGNPLHSSDTAESTVTPPYEIPYGCLVSESVDNLIVAGRIISATHVVNSSLRVMGIVHIIGQAAGNAAYLAIKDNRTVSNIDIEALRSMQREQGVNVSLSKR